MVTVRSWLTWTVHAAVTILKGPAIVCEVVAGQAMMTAVSAALASAAAPVASMTGRGRGGVR
jgi:hypothetical protein